MVETAERDGLLRPGSVLVESAAGDREALADWVARKEQASERRHKRLYLGGQHSGVGCQPAGHLGMF
jgi:hypothetical protein